MLGKALPHRELSPTAIAVAVDTPSPASRGGFHLPPIDQSASTLLPGHRCFQTLQRGPSVFAGWGFPNVEGQGLFPIIPFRCVFHQLAELFWTFGLGWL